MEDSRQLFFRLQNQVVLVNKMTKKYHIVMSSLEGVIDGIYVCGDPLGALYSQFTKNFTLGGLGLRNTINHPNWICKSCDKGSIASLNLLNNPR